MKIDNSRIFIGTVYKSVHFTKDVLFNNPFGDSFGSFNYDLKPHHENVIMIKFAHMYVAVEDVSTLSKYLDIKSHVHGSAIWYPDQRFLDTHADHINQLCIKHDEIKPLFDKPGRTSIGCLLKRQEELDYIDEFAHVQAYNPTKDKDLAKLSRILPTQNELPATSTFANVKLDR